MEALIILILLIIFVVFIVKITKRKPKNNLELEKPEKQVQLDLSFEKHEDSKGIKGEYLILDIETTGLPKKRNSIPEELSNWPRIVQIAWILFDKDKKIIEKQNFIIKQEKKVPQEAIDIHGITNEMVKKEGVPAIEVFEKLEYAIDSAEYIIAHNLDFDIPIIQSEFIRANKRKPFINKKKICTMKSTIDFCALTKLYGNGFKYPTLVELVKECFYSEYNTISIGDAHNAEVDTLLTAKSFFYLLDNEIISTENYSLEQDYSIILDNNLNILEHINLTKEKISDSQIDSLFYKADKLCKTATELFKHDKSESIKLIIKAINSFPFIVPRYFHKLAYYLQRAKLYNQSYEILNYVIDDLDFNAIGMYNMDKSINYEKYCSVKYSAKEYKDYLYYFFKWYYNKLLAYTFQGRIDELDNMINTENKISLKAPSKTLGCFKHMKIEDKVNFFNDSIKDYTLELANTLIPTCEAIRELDNNLDLEPGVTVGEALDKKIRNEESLYETYKYLNDSLDDNYFKEYIEKKIN
ncbi:MAG: exonuclease domain-containing protein [bacterium]